MLCDGVLRGNHNSTGNFISHYKLKHNSKLDELKEYTKDNVKKNNEKNANAPTEENVCFCKLTIIFDFLFK